MDRSGDFLGLPASVREVASDTDSTATSSALMRTALEAVLEAIRDRLPAALDASGGLKVKEQP